MKFIDTNRDRWFEAGGDVAAADGTASPIAPAPHLLLTHAQWQTLRATWPEALPVGVALPNDVAVSEIAADLPRLALVVLQFPKWTDGRAYSQAHLLRVRWRFSGEMRARGDVLVDMLPLLQRNGFDSVVLRPDQSVDAARRALTFVPAFYQGDAVAPAPRFAEAAA